MNDLINKSNKIWLNFFNEYLYKNGVLTELERDKMINKISNFYHNISINKILETKSKV